MKYLTFSHPYEVQREQNGKKLDNEVRVHMQKLEEMEKGSFCVDSSTQNQIIFSLLIFHSCVSFITLIFFVYMLFACISK